MPVFGEFGVGMEWSEESDGVEGGEEFEEAGVGGE